jgi:hypothetical protein
MNLPRSRRRSPLARLLDIAFVADPSFSHTARLMYVLLIAGTDEDGLAEVHRMLGLDEGGAAPFLEELVAAGAVEMGRHGNDTADTLTVHAIAVDEPRGCLRCSRCDDCACHEESVPCRRCAGRERTRRAAEEDLARWQRELDSGRTYAHGSTGSLLHRWDCRSLPSEEAVRTALAWLDDDSAVRAARAGGLGDASGAIGLPSMPRLFNADELRRRPRRRRNCRLCAPDPI